MHRLKLVVAEGKTKRIFKADNGKVLIQNKNEITANDGLKRDVMASKAVSATRTTCNVFGLLEQADVPNHFICRIDDITFEALRMQMIPIEIVVRCRAEGSYLKRNPGVAIGSVFNKLVVEMFDKDDALHDPMLEFDFETGMLRKYDASKPREEAIIDVGPLSESRHSWITPNYFKKLVDLATNTFIVIEQAWSMQGGELFDLKIECGFDSKNHKLYVADVIDNDSWRLKFNGESKDKDAYRKGSKSLASIEEDYRIVAELSDAFRYIRA